MTPPEASVPVILEKTAARRMEELYDRLGAHA